MNGFIAIICVGEAHWCSLTKLMERVDLASDPRFATLASRVAHMDDVDELVSAWTRLHPTESLFHKMMEAHVPCAPVRTLDEVVNDPNMHARAALQWLDHPQLGRIVVQNSPMRYEGLPPRPLTPSRPLGADTDAVLQSILKT